MTTDRAGPRRLGGAVLLATVALMAAACSTDPDIDELLADAATSSSAPATTPATSDDDASPGVTSGSGSPAASAPPADPVAPTEVPDATGLPSISEPDPAIISGELDNGLVYHVRQNDNPGGSVELRLAVDAGSALEDDDQPGVAHFLEHMVFNGTEDYPENELVAVLRSFGSGFGADINAYTDYDETVYELTVPSDAIGTGLDVLEQFLTSVTLAEADVVAERGVVLDEWRGAAASSDGRILDAYTTLYLDDTPYAGRLPIGTADAISTMTPELLRRYYDDWYRPDNAAVVVVGDIAVDEVLDLIAGHFGPATSRGDSPDRPELTIQPSADARVERLADPDVPEGFVGFALPVASAASAADGSHEAQLQRALYDDLAVDIVGERLSNDAATGEVPFDAARVDTGDLVRALDVPEISVVADGADLESAAEHLIDEFERVRRYGFTPDEVERAVAVMRRSARSSYEGRESRQDRSFADEYVRHFLEGEPVPTAEATVDYFSAVLDRATPETIADGLVERLNAMAGYSIVVLPAGADDDVPSADHFVELIDGRQDRSVEPRDDSAAEVGDTLLEPPSPVEEVSAERLVDDPVPLVDPLLLTFDNGVRVSLNANQIEEGLVRLSAASPGGKALVDEAQIPDATAVGPVLSRSGLGDLDAVQLEQLLAGTDVGLETRVDDFVDRLDGVAATSDLETLFQLVHLTMTAPRIDPVAVEQYLDDELPYAADPGLDARYAEAFAYRRARYDDPRFLLPTVESLASVDAAGVEQVARQRFGDASDWSFSLSGDLAVDDAVQLARTYLGTLPGDGAVEDPGFVEPAPPVGVIQETVEGGTGERAGIAFHFSRRAEPSRKDRILAAYVGEVVTIRLTDVIRERLGESYSAFADVQTTGGPAPYADAYVSVTAGAETAASVSAAVLGELASLAEDGPTEAEYQAAREAIVRQGALFDNGEINDEVLDVLVDPAVERLDTYLLDGLIADSITSDEVRDAVGRWMPLDQYIEIRTVPR